MENYKLYRSERGSRGGGAATYVSSHLKSHLIALNKPPVNFEGLFVRIILHENKQLIVGNIYKPPNSPKLESVKNIVSIVSPLRNNKEIILMGDFNINWLDPSAFAERNMFNSCVATYYITNTCYLKVKIPFRLGLGISPE